MSSRVSLGRSASVTSKLALSDTEAETSAPARLQHSNSASNSKSDVFSARGALVLRVVKTVSDRNGSTSSKRIYGFQNRPASLTVKRFSFESHDRGTPSKWRQCLPRAQPAPQLGHCRQQMSRHNPDFAATALPVQATGFPSADRSIQG